MSSRLEQTRWPGYPTGADSFDYVVGAGHYRPAVAVDNTTKAGTEAGHYRPAIGVDNTTKAGTEAGHYRPAIGVDNTTKAGTETGHYRRLYSRR